MDGLGLSVGVSLGCCSSARGCWPRPFQTPACRGFAYFAMFCSLPTYVMLWNAQVHVCSLWPWH